MKKVKLGDYVKISTGKLDANASSLDGKYPFFTCSKTPLKIDSYSYDCECVLIAGNGEINAKYYHGKFDAYQRTYIIESKDNSKLLVKYIYYFMLFYIDILKEESIGGVIKYIKLNNLTDAEIPLVSIEEQELIIQCFEMLYSAIGRNEQILINSEEVIKSRFVEIFGDPIKNNKNLPLEKLENLGLLKRGTSKHRPRNAPELLNGPYPLIQTGDVSNSDTFITKYNSTYSELGLKQSKLWKKGTLCITIAANIAETAILDFDACFPDSVVGFIPNELVNSLYIHTWFKFLQPILEDKATAVAQKNLNVETLGKIGVIIPPMSAQLEFVDFLMLIEKMKLVVKRKNNLIHELIRKKMNDFFK